MQILTDDGYIRISRKDIVNGTLTIPNGMKVINKIVLDNSDGSYFNIRHIEIPKSVKYIGSKAFYNFPNLQIVDLSEGLIEIGYKAFSYCKNLKYINFPKSLKSINSEAFEYCSSLKKVVLFENIENIGERAFYHNESLKSVTINKDANLEKINDDTFAYCGELSVVDLPDMLETIGESAFRDCLSLKFISFPDKLEQIEAQAFRESGLISVDMPDSVRKMGRFVFHQCRSLTSVKLSESLKNIPAFTFRECKKLKKIRIPDSVEIIGEDAFCQCESLEEVRFSNRLRIIGKYGFAYCVKLKEIEFPDSLEKLAESSFFSSSLEEVKFGNRLKNIGANSFENNSIKNLILPESLEYIGSSAFYGCEFYRVEIPKNVKKIGVTAFPRTMDKFTIYHDLDIAQQEMFHYNLTIKNRHTGESVTKEIIDGNWHNRNKIEIINNKNVGLELLEHVKKRKQIAMFYDCTNKWVEIDVEKLQEYIDPNKISYKRAYEWSKIKKFKPAMCVMSNFPVDEINNFYINKNNKRWGELLKLSKLKDEEEIGAFFKLSYSLGLFSKMGKDSEKAYNFIKKEIIKKEKRGKYHVRFEEMDVEKIKFDKDFANLVFLHYPKSKKRKFLVDNDENGELVDYFASVYNSFPLIKEIYENKTVKTTTIRDMLTPELCILATEARVYDNVNEGNELLAKYIGLYGYDQDTFENAQRLFEIGKSMPESEITLHIKEDKSNAMVTYELLDKDNPLGVVVGNITNCCQTLEGLGSSCVEYGLKEPNSKFMVFKNNEKIIGQSWVWYDEQTQKICLDNIELPESIAKNKIKFILLKNELISCLKRMTKSFVKTMEEKELEVDTITVGSGYNEMNKWLGMHYKKSNDEPQLSGYHGYSDASEQYILYKKR